MPKWYLKKSKTHCFRRDATFCDSSLLFQKWMNYSHCNFFQRWSGTPHQPHAHKLTEFKLQGLPQKSQWQKEKPPWSIVSLRCLSPQCLHPVPFAYPSLSLLSAPPAGMNGRLPTLPASDQVLTTSRSFSALWSVVFFHTSEFTMVTWRRILNCLVIPFHDHFGVL